MLRFTATFLLATIGWSLLLSHPTSALVTHQSITSPSTRQSLALSMSDDKSVNLFESPSWIPIKQDLDSVPIFCVANKDGKPIAYSITVKKKEDGTDKTFQVPFFYTNVDDALEELKKAKSANTEASKELDLIPFPLGVAFELWAKDQAVIVPSKQAIQQAGAPPNTNPIGQSVPLFACMEIMQETEVKDGDEMKMVPVLPLFMVLEDCNEAVEQAVEMDGGNSDEFEVVSLSLNRAIEQLAANAENTAGGSPGFQFIPPKSSMEYINKYLAESGDSGISSPPPPPPL